MAISDIQLTAGMRNNLISLQGTVDMLNRTQERLATGKKVNSALDNATSYFAAKGHMDRANDLSSLKDAMGEAIQTIKAADTGISGISDLIESMKGLAQSAYTSTDPATIVTQYNALIDQLDSLAGDSGYKGTNLLGSDTLTVVFNEDGSASLAVAGFDGSSTGLSISDATDFSVAANIDAAIAELDAALETLRTQAQTLSANLSVVTARQEFTNNMINVLTAGADNLTAADVNEEGANMLALQTRQSLGTTALSLSAQAAQSVLRLF